jgi:hypothetical protein
VRSPRLNRENRVHREFIAEAISPELIVFFCLALESDRNVRHQDFICSVS